MGQTKLLKLDHEAFTNGTVCVVAMSEEDADRLYRAHLGGDGWIEFNWRAMGHMETLTLRVMGYDCAVADEEAQDVWFLTMPCAAWVLKQGRGFLGEMQ